MSGKQTGHVWALIQEWLDAQVYPPSQRKLATQLGIAHTTLTDWKYARSQLQPEHVRDLADELGVPYERVLDAALVDAGYREARRKIG